MEFLRTDFNLFKVASVLTHASMQCHAWGKAHTILFQVEKATALEPPEGTLVMGDLAVVVACPADQGGPLHWRSCGSPIHLEEYRSLDSRPLIVR